MIFKPRQLKRKKIFLITLAGLIIILGLGFFGFKTFTANKLTRFDIDAQNLNCATVSDISSFLVSKNLNYFYFKSSALETDLRNKFFCIGKIESNVSYPDKLKLKIYGREAKFVVIPVNPTINPNPTIELNLDQMSATESTKEAYPPKVVNEILNSYKDASPGAMFLVDEDGMVFAETGTDVGFKRLSLFSSSLKIGQTIPDDTVKKVDQILTKLSGMDISTDNLLVVGERLIIDTKPRVTFALNKDILRQAASLQLILRQAKMKSDPDSKDSKFVESIDLRFDRPVVVYSKN